MWSLEEYLSHGAGIVYVLKRSLDPVKNLLSRSEFVQTIILELALQEARGSQKTEEKSFPACVCYCFFWTWHGSVERFLCDKILVPSYLDRICKNISLPRSSCEGSHGTKISFRWTFEVIVIFERLLSPAKKQKKSFEWGKKWVEKRETEITLSFFISELTLDPSQKKSAERQKRHHFLSSWVRFFGHCQR